MIENNENLTKRRKQHNPYLIPFLTLAAICCAALCIIFYLFFVINENENQKSYNQNKLHLILNDFENQLTLFKDASLRISVSSQYRPYYFERNKYNEILLLNDFKQYRYFSSLTDELFLYYGSDSIFLSNGNTTSLKSFLSDLNEEEFTALLNTIKTSPTDFRIVSAGGNVYLLYSLDISGYTSDPVPVLCCVITHNQMAERFTLISGGLHGQLTMYYNDSVIYQYGTYPIRADQPSALTSSSEDGQFTLCFLPNSSNFQISPLFPLQIFLIGLNIFIILFFTKTLADRSYRPIIDFTENYREKILPENFEESKNAFEEMNYLMDSMLKRNTSTNQLLQQKQKLLRRQVLRLLISDSQSFDQLPSFDTLSLELPGPFYYVTTISFERDNTISDETLAMIQESLEGISSLLTSEYVYAICNFTKKQVITICSISSRERQSDLTDHIYEAAKNYSQNYIIGVGNVYPDLTKVSASFLESTDSVYNQLNKQKQSLAPEAYANTTEILQIINALNACDEETAISYLNQYIDRFDDAQLSLLMQQYIFSNFLGEVTKLARTHRIELSSQSLSLVISAKNLKSFCSGAQNIISEFCEKLIRSKEQETTDQTHRIFEFLNRNFADNNLSIEMAADELGTTTESVRQAVLEKTGKQYKDYIISLRVEYAKKLLLTEPLSVNEICEKTGYNNVSHFIQLFKKMTGTTPAKYRSSSKKADTA